ncbi:MAG: nitric oxide reductase activation protein [Pseudomonadota bacterium]
MSKSSALNLTEIAQRLDVSLQVEFTFYHTHELAQTILPLARADQEFYLTWVERVASTHLEISHQFAQRGAELIARMDKHVLEAWLIHAMDTYDIDGLFPAMKIIRNVDQFLHSAHERTAGVALTAQRGVLLHFLQGLSGRQLKVNEGDAAYTDGETVFLPAFVAMFPHVDDNFKLLKAMAALQWAQTRFGTLRLPLQDLIMEHDDPQGFLALFHALETQRLEACLQRELPGLYRDMLRIGTPHSGAAPDTQWRDIVAPLRPATATAEHSLALAQSLFGKVAPPTPRIYQGELRPHEVLQIRLARIEREKARLKVALHDLLTEQAAKPETAPPPSRFDMRETTDPSVPEGARMELTLDDMPVAPPEGVKNLLTSIMLDFDEIPPEYLVPAGPGEYDPRLLHDEEPNADDVWSGTYHEEGAFLYKEWDYRRQHYRKNWCAVREKTVTAQDDGFYANTLKKYATQLRHLRRTFEAMRDEDRLLKRQLDGEDVDIDALVEALADQRAGQEMSDRLFTRMHRADRNIAVCFMVDMSGSTQGWINLAEREALILLCEALEHLGDRYAIYGFSGFARKRCEIFKIKEFSDPYNSEIKNRISGIQPQDYTRMGFAIRHLSGKLLAVDAKTRILITLSDGRPYDYDYYCDDYGIEDTRRALIETRLSGIHPYCITIDQTAHDYLSHMYGAASYTVLDDIARLPYKVTDIYKKLTT